jgi:hypothetical protein
MKGGSMADLKSIIKNLSEKTSKLQSVPQEKILREAKMAEAASAASKILETGKVQPGRKG